MRLLKTIMKLLIRRARSFPWRIEGFRMLPGLRSEQEGEEEQGEEGKEPNSRTRQGMKKKKVEKNFRGRVSPSSPHCQSPGSLSRWG